MSEGYKHPVQNGDKGLTYIFLQKAKTDGFQGDAKDVDWTKVMSVFDEIQGEKQQNKTGDSLFSGGTDKTKKGWGKSYVIHKKDSLNVTGEQLTKIYDAMGFKPEKKVAEEVKPAPPVAEPSSSPAVEAKVPTEAPAKEEVKPAPATKEQIQERTEQIAAKKSVDNQDNLFNTVARGGSIKNLKSSDAIKKEAAAAAEAELNPPAKTSAPTVSTESNTGKPAEPNKKVLTAEEKQDNFIALVTGRRPVKKAESKAPVEAPKPVAPATSPAEAPKPANTAQAPTAEPIAASAAKEKAPAPAPAVEAKPSAAPEAAKVSIPVPSPESTPAAASKSPTAPATSPDAQFNKLKTPTINGKYQIIAEDNKEGFRLATEIETIGQPEAKKFFQQRPLYTAKTNEWSIRGVLGEDALEVQNKADRVATGLSINTAIYSDLVAKQKAGTPLSEAEKKFVQSHIAELKKYGLQLNDKNEIIEIPKN